ncbi:hypothetical protein [Methyloprofundus sp.]|uniref:hypothetical protein n=1 Tax=Methyloprofundus sp. TaxID=2020875 RepID=UPI003D0F6FF8
MTDKPCSRKTHLGEIPLIGGICIYFTLLILLPWTQIENFWYIASATLIVVCGVIDDYQHLSFKVRLSIEIIATIIMIYWGGIEITNMGNLFGLGDIQLGIFSPLVTIFAFVGGINAFNMSDGIDGATAGLSLVAMCSIIVMFSIYGLAKQPSLCINFFLIFTPALIAFLLFNTRIFGRKSAFIFLGDAGSKLLGFTVCYLLIFISQGENSVISPVTVLWIIAVPLIDAVCIFIRRAHKGKSIFTPDREHFHHILPLAGYSMNQTLSIILFTPLSLGCFGILGEKLFKLPEWLMFALFLGLFFLYYWAMSHAWKVMKVARKLHTD